MIKGVDHLTSFSSPLGCQKAPRTGSQRRHFMAPKRCPKNGMLSDPKCPPNLVFCVPCGPWKSCENVQLSSKNTCFAFSYTIASRYQKWANLATKRDPQIDQHVSKSLVKTWCVFASESDVILEPKMTPKRPQNDPHVQPNGTPGRSGGLLGVPWDPKDVPKPIWAPFWCPTWHQNVQNELQNDPKITKMTPQMTPQRSIVWGFSSEGFSSQGFSSELALEASAPKASDHGVEGFSIERSRI